MRRVIPTLTVIATLSACSGGRGGEGSNVHAYQAAASVGDFITLTIDRNAKTITYVNITNGDSGTVPFTTRPDGAMDVSDPNGDIVQCYELPGTGVVCSGANLGPTGSRQPALLYGVLKQPLTLDDLKNASVGYLQFRTKEGGIEVGHVAFDSSVNGAGSGYYPVNQVLPPGWYGKPMFASQTMVSTDWANNSALGCVQWTEPGTGMVSHVFGTPGGNFMVDTPSGAMFVFRDAATSSFDPSHAGTYTALVYEKTVSYVAGVETGSPTISTATVDITSAGHITVTSGTTSIVHDASLLPFAGSAWQGVNEVTDPVKGLFYFSDASNASSYGTPPMFVTFFDGALAFGEFVPISSGDFAAEPQVAAQYKYIYGIAVKAP